MPDSREQLCRLWLQFSEGVGAQAKAKLLARSGSYEAVFDGFPGSCTGLLSQRSIDELERLKAFGLDRMLARLEELQIQACFRGEPDYPQLLDAIPGPPDLLFVRGRMPPGEQRAVAIVGSRRETRYGRDQAFSIARDLAQQGVTIVSGLARGIDTAAHKGALAGGGRTVAVLGSGHNQLYPQENKPLAEEIAASGGAVVSELPPNTPPMAYHFPVRNRIVSGLAQALLLVEAREKSGTLITVGHALEQGREVFALPGEVHSPGSLIPHRMIREGARLCTGAQDILEDMGWQTDMEPVTAQSSLWQMELSEAQRALCSLLQDEPLYFDELLQRSGLDSASLSTEITMLEMAGAIVALPGRQFRLTGA